MITTTFLNPPVPDRNHDWHAHFDWQTADDLSCEGYGQSEDAAVLELLERAVEVDLDGSEQEEVVDLAYKGWLHREDFGLHKKLTALRAKLKKQIEVSDRLYGIETAQSDRSVHYGMKSAYEDTLREVERALGLSAPELLAAE